MHTAGLERRLEEIDIQTKRLECLAHVIGKCRIELQLRYVSKMISSINAGITAGKVDEMNNSSIVAMCALELGLCTQQVGIHVKALPDSYIRTHELGIDILRQQCRRAVAVEP